MQLAKQRFYGRSRNIVIRVYDEVSNEIEAHEHPNDFKNS